MRQRWRLGIRLLAVVVVLAVVTAIMAGWQPIRLLIASFERTQPTIRLGLLHSQSGSLAISEKSLLDAELLAIEELNAEGGIGNRKLVWTAPDCRSDPAVFATEAKRLIEDEKAVALFGTWNSECRKAVVPVVTDHASLLFFPGNFEGIETSSRVVYVGGAANQSVLPAVRWAYDSLKSRRFYVIGLEEVWSRCSSEIGKDGVKAAGAEVVGESYLRPLAPNFDEVINNIRQAKPDIVLNFLYGETNIGFYSAIHRAGFTAQDLPIIAFGFGEDESRRFVPADVTGHYAAWNYFQSINRKENRDFIQKFRAKYGEERAIGDSMVAAYNGIKFWAKSAHELGTTDVSAVMSNLNRQSMDAPDGIITIDPDSRVVWRPFHLGRIRPDGQFEVIWSIVRPIRPVLYVATRTAEDWRKFLDTLKVQWQGRWSASSSTNP